MAAGWSWRVLVVAAAVYLLLLLVVELRVLAIAFIIAMLLTALLSPVARGLRRLRLPPALAALVTLLLLLGVLVLAGLLVGNGIATQFDDLRTSVTAGFLRATEYLERFGVNAVQIDDLRRQLVEAVSDSRSRIISGVLSTATIAAEVVTGVVLALFTLFFLLKDGHGIWAWVTRLFVPRLRGQVDEVGRLGWFALGGYMRGIVVVALADAVFVGIALLLLDVPLVLPLVLVTFLGAFVPIAGAFVSGLFAVLVALVAQGPLVAAGVFLAFLVVQQAEGNVLHPIVMRRAVSLHPLVTVVAVVVGASLAGVVGAIVSVPLAALVNVVISYLVEQQRLVRLATEQIDLLGADAEPAFPVLARMSGFPTAATPVDDGIPRRPRALEEGRLAPTAPATQPPEPSQEDKT